MYTILWNNMEQDLKLKNNKYCVYGKFHDNIWFIFSFSQLFKKVDISRYGTNHFEMHFSNSWLRKSKTIFIIKRLGNKNYVLMWNVCFYDNNCLLMLSKLKRNKRNHDATNFVHHFVINCVKFRLLTKWKDKQYSNIHSFLHSFCGIV